jgi:DNA-binding response OmpR family regulator
VSQAATASSAASSTAGSAGARILVVDDLEANRDALGRRLARRGYQVELAADGQAALERIAADPPVDLVLLDVMMPGISGYEVLEAVRHTKSLVELPIIMATAKDESEDIVKAMELGANDYVTKPLDFKRSCR